MEDGEHTGDSSTGRGGPVRHERSRAATGAVPGDSPYHGHYWVFTINNPTDEDVQRFKRLCNVESEPNDDDNNDLDNIAPAGSSVYREYDGVPSLPLGTPPAGFTYLIWSLERGENGTKHIQGYCEFEAKKRQGAAQKALLPREPTRVHVERRRGTAAEAADYCRKEDTHIEGTTSVLARGRITEHRNGRSDTWFYSGSWWIYDSRYANEPVDANTRIYAMITGADRHKHTRRARWAIEDKFCVIGN